MHQIIETAVSQLTQLKENAITQYRRHPIPLTFFHHYGQALDSTLATLWSSFFADTPDLALLAIGGYGRQEMYPFSDLDLAITAQRPFTENELKQIETFVQTLWDIRLSPAVKVGTITELVESACDDITSDTAFLEARYLQGNHSVYLQLMQQLDGQRDIAAFIEAKLVEMQQRHAKTQGSGTLLEPNVKTCPGGLRDIHTMIWLAKAQGLSDDVHSLIQQKIITATEAKMFVNSHKRLAKIRIDLHLTANRAEDRLIFDLQTQVAEVQGLQDDERHIKSEKLMRTLYRATKVVKQLNGIMLPMLRGRVYSSLPRIVHPIDHDYYQIGNQIAAQDPQIFRQQPEHIFKIISILQTRNDLTTIAPDTLRAWWSASQHIDSSFYANPKNRQRFIQFFEEGNGLSHIIRFLNLYGVLGRYLPAWGKIVGLLQHDLFHIYPVDDHILMVLRNMRRLALDAHSHELPFASTLMHAYDKPTILYLAALFHDIAKGRGGDHSKQGVEDARKFAQDHFLSESDTDLLTWLVEQHLLMSSTAQKEDIQDPDVIHRFCEKVGTPDRLTALYLLTVADIRGTNPKLWNDWKANLLQTLFQAAIRHFSGDKKTRSVLVSRRQDAAQQLLDEACTPAAMQKKLWQVLGPAYFVRHELQEILWHTANLIYNFETPQARCRQLPESEALQVMIFMPNAPRIFAGVCRIFSHLGFNILAARAYVTEHNYVLDTFIIEPPQDYQHHDFLYLQNTLEATLNNFIHGNRISYQSANSIKSRRSRHQPIAPAIVLMPEEDHPGWYTLELVAVNRDYLLADIAEVLSAHNISLRYAKIMTTDERVEDSFVLYSPQLEQAKNQLALKQALVAVLSI